MKKGVVILIIIGTLCYFGTQWFFKKYPRSSRHNIPVKIAQSVPTNDRQGTEVIYMEDIIADTSSAESASEVQTPQEAESIIEPTEPHPIEQAELHIKEGRKYEARNVLSDAYFAEESEVRREQIKELLDELNGELIFSPDASADADVYVVKPGDTLSKIARQYGTSYELIMRLNRKENTLLRVNEKLKVLKGTLSLLVDKSDFTLTVLLDGHYIKQYPVGTGVKGKTPVGVFKIKNKLKNPVWYSPEGVYEYGHPKNILGTRWLGFVDKPGLKGYGIHGTALPETIGEESSMGCVRMYNKDVEELYDFVVPGAEVKIQE